MKKTTPLRWTILFTFVGRAAWAQTLPPEALQQLDSAIGQRVEATAVLGTQSITSRAGLGWKLNDADGTIYKIPWDFPLWDPAPIGDSDLSWALEVDGGLGYGWFVNHFNNNILKGNESKFQTVALALGTGPRLYFGDSGFSVRPSFDLLYAYTDNDFDAGTAFGQQVVADGRYVNWNVNTISFVPAFDVQYQKAFGRWTPKVTSDFAYYDTLPITRSTDALSFRSDSMVWANRLGLDYLTPWQTFDCPMHFGSDLARTDFYQGLRGALGTDHFYQVSARVTWDVLDRLWKFKSVGFSGGYFWCPAFSGYSFGLEASFKF